MRKHSFLGLDFSYSLIGMEKCRFTGCQSLKRPSNLSFWDPNSQIKKINMQTPTFQLVGKRRISSFNSLSRVLDWRISPWSSLRGKSLWLHVYKVPISEWLLPEQVLWCRWWIVQWHLLVGSHHPATMPLGSSPYTYSGFGFVIGFGHCHPSGNLKSACLLGFFPSLAFLATPWLPPWNQARASLLDDERHVALLPPSLQQTAS